MLEKVWKVPRKYYSVDKEKSELKIVFIAFKNLGYKTVIGIMSNNIVGYVDHWWSKMFVQNTYC